jgi:transcriptional regulator with XRE-family HTH domain
MNDVRSKIAELQDKGWTLAAIADEIGVTVNAVEKWKAGDRYPRPDKPILDILDRVAKRKRIPKQRRYAKGSRRRSEFEARRG